MSRAGHVTDAANRGRDRRGTRAGAALGSGLEQLQASKSSAHFVNVAAVRIRRARGAARPDTAARAAPAALLPAAPLARTSGGGTQDAERATAPRVRFLRPPHLPTAAAAAPQVTAEFTQLAWPPYCLQTPLLRLHHAGPACHCSCSACCSPHCAPPGSTRWQRQAAARRRHCSRPLITTSCAGTARQV